MFTANLVSRATSWQMRPVADYRPGDAKSFQAIVYVGSVYDGELSRDFLRDAARGTVPVVWIGSNIWQLFADSPELASRLGWQATGYRTDLVTTVDYKGVALKRNTHADTGVMGVSLGPGGRRANVLAVARADDGTTSAWAVRSKNLTYMAELPYAYVGTQDRYLAAADILLGALAPNTAERKRSLVRIEDVGPHTDPRQLRQITDYLITRGVPFSLAVYPYYADPQGKANQGRPTYQRLVDSPELVSVLRDSVNRGGNLIMHGYSHQYGDKPNPYSAVSADDYEFYRASVQSNGNVLLGGPVPDDSATWFRNRIAIGLNEFTRVGLPQPTMFEFPHYGASAVDYQEAGSIFAARYERGNYYAGQCLEWKCGSTSVSYDEVYGQFFPYPVRDIYGAIVVPENVGNVAPAVFNNHASRSVEDILADARANRVVRDSVVSFFYHPFLGVDGLRKLVDGVAGAGYTFVSPVDVAHG
ncbi:DUF2334 domain-containing protein [Amycolatopsis sp. A1MSW2902]|uniref:DUF2334 domain-containing protein n=1 Tax=Amycolatopsis sp. A1MSW2902 TaxID=687413 RepID=UPI00307F66B1